MANCLESQLSRENRACVQACWDCGHVRWLAGSDLNGLRGKTEICLCLLIRSWETWGGSTKQCALSADIKLMTQSSSIWAGCLFYTSLKYNGTDSPASCVGSHLFNSQSDDSPKKQLVLNIWHSKKLQNIWFLVILLDLLTAGKIKKQTHVLLLKRHHWFGGFVLYVYNWTNNNPGLKFNTLFCWVWPFSLNPGLELLCGSLHLVLPLGSWEVLLSHIYFLMLRTNYGANATKPH